jgi:hypothetical protein
MEQLPLDFSQPPNRLTAIADVERKKNIVKNDYNQQGNAYSSTNPDALADGDAIGRGTGAFLDVYNDSIGTSVDIFERKMNIKFNAYQVNKPYNVRGEV